MKSIALSELAGIIEDALATSIDSTYWVRAEIASMTVRGHCYIDLVEKSGRGLFAAKMRATCWQNTYAMLSAYFEKETGKSLSAGMNVLLEVEVNFHSVYGLSLNIVGIDPSFTLGDMAKTRQQTIERLQKEGVFELNKQYELPTIIKRVAVISASNAAGYEDFMHMLPIHTTLFAATMQGDEAEQSIIRALKAIASTADEFDCVVMIRGGGASTDLSCFDSYELALHCAQFPLPILTGIGHTRDISVVDMVVHTALKTPTAVAEYIMDHNLVQVQRIEDLRRRLQLVAINMVARRKAQIERMQLMLDSAIRNTLAIHRHKLAMYHEQIRLQSPERIFALGYSLTTMNGRVLKSGDELHDGDTIQTVFKKGSVESIVKK